MFSLRNDSQNLIYSWLDDKSTKIPAVGSDGEFWISKVLSTVEQLEAEKKSFTLLTEVDEEDVVIYAKARDTIAKLRKVYSKLFLAG